MFIAKKILTAFFLPPLGLIFLAVLGLWLIKKHPKTGKTISYSALFTLGLMCFPFVSHPLMQTLEPFPPISATQLKQAQAMVILGGGTYRNPPEYKQDTVNRWALERIRYGAYLQKQSGLPILVTGGSVFGERPEAQAMTEAVERDFGGKVRWQEPASRDTAENAAFSAELLKKDGIHTIALISHGWHLPRAKELFERHGLTVIPAPTSFTTNTTDSLDYWLPSVHDLQQSAMAIREWVGIGVQRLTKN